MKKLNKDELTNLFNKGTNELNNGNPLKAVEFYKKILFVRKDNEVVLNNLAYAYYKLEDYANSEKFILKSININKNNPYFYHNLGNLYKTQNKFEDSIKIYEEGIKINPKFYLSHHPL